MTAAKRGRPRKPTGTTLDVMLGLRLSEAESARLDAMAAKVPFATRHGLARACLLLGLAAVERNPEVLKRLS